MPYLVNGGVEDDGCDADIFHFWSLVTGLWLLAVGLSPLVAGC
jgi:hypothetical protein